MGKFGIGARVRDRDGDLAEVIGKPEKGWREVRILGGKHDGMTYWALKSELEVVPASASAAFTITACADGVTSKTFDASTFAVTDGEPEFEVGQRVVMVQPRYGEFSPVVARITGDDGQDYLPLQIEFEAEVDFGHGTPATWYVDQDDITPFTLEAGKFYRTRDGRKVGPMERTSGLTKWPWQNPENGDSYRDDGTFDVDVGYARDEDIVAEWVEPAEPADAETIVVEDATDPMLTVVAGKRYRGKSGAEHDVVANSDNVFWPLTNGAFDRFWKEDGTAYNEGRWNEFCPAADDLVELVAPRLPSTAPLSVDDEVILSAPARISGFDKKNAHVVLDTGGSFVLPIASLRLAA